jgi:mono/diheme cytochrome c family protein
MTSTARRIAFSLAGAAALGALVFAGLYALSETSGHNDAPAGAAAVLPAADTITRGEYLSRAGNCMACHTDRGGLPWAGGRALATPFGTLYASNLTPDARTGLGAWTAEDFWRALHHGRSRDGRMLYPAFPYTHYTRVTRADADAMYAFLRTLTPVQQPNTPHALRWPYSTQAALAVWRALYFRPGGHREEPARGAQWNRGAYLVQGLGHCAACHSARNAWGASEVLDLSGGMIPMQSWYAPSLASPVEAGVAGWRVDDIVRLLRTGASPDTSTLGPMAEVVLHSTQHLQESDLRSMAVFLQSVPPGPGAKPSQVPPVPASVAQRGARIYADHCAQCHGDKGEGVNGAYPRLAGNRAVTLQVTANLVQVTIHGAYPPATEGQPRPFGMPPFALTLSDADIAAVLTFVRGAWGNTAGGVSELDVAQQRSARY